MSIKIDELIERGEMKIHVDHLTSRSPLYSFCYQVMRDRGFRSSVRRTGDYYTVKKV